LNYVPPVSHDSVDLFPVDGESLVVDAAGGDFVVVPGGRWFLGADFVRQGPDLLLDGKDGEQVLVKDYFSHGSAPDLVSGDGATISADVAARLAGPVAPGQVAQAGPQADAEPIGKVETVDGTVTAQRADGTEVALQKGDPVFQGDVLETSADGAVGIVFVDDSTFSLAEDARMTLDEMVYDPGTQEGAFKATLVQGVFSFISGQISKTDPEAMTIETPLAVIGIRGTTGAINLPAGEPLTVVLTADAGGTVGEITVFNAAGVQVLNAPFQATQVAGLNVPPSTTFTMSVEEFNNSFGRALAALPPSPDAGGNGDDDEQGDEGGEGEGEGSGEEEAEGEEGGDGDGEPGGDGEFGPGDAFDQAMADMMSGVQDIVMAGSLGADELDQAIEDMVSSAFQENPFFAAYNPYSDPDDPNQVLTTEFQEVLTATSGDDQLLGGSSNTNFVMAQAANNAPIPSGGIGGVDTVDGGGGTDQITFDQLHSVSGRLDAATSKLYMWDGISTDPMTLSDSTAALSVTFQNMEQLYFGSYDGSADAAFPISFSFGASFTGLVVAGSTGNDEINWSSGTLNWYSGADAVLVFGGCGNDILYGSGVADDLQGGAGNDTLYGAGGSNSLSGGAGNDTIYVDGTTNTVKGGDGDDTIYVEGATSGNTINGGSDSSIGDTLNFSSLGASVQFNFNGSAANVTHGGSGGGDVSGIENYVGSGLADTINLNGDMSSLGIDDLNGGAGADTFNVAAGTTFSGKLSGGGGSDTINLHAAGSYTVYYQANSEFGDTINYFTGGSSGSIFDFDSGLVSGTEGTVFQQLAGGGAAGGSSGALVITTDVSDPTNAGTVATELSGMSLTGLNANDVRFIAVGNAGSTTLWQWTDAGNGGIDSGELDKVADLAGLDTDTLTQDNFADFSVT
jgi:hemolysin type calcium-binding protein/FecR-like protein